MGTLSAKAAEQPLLGVKASRARETSLVRVPLLGSLVLLNIMPRGVTPPPI